MTIKRKWGEESVFIILDGDDIATVVSTEDRAHTRIQELLGGGTDSTDILIYEARKLDFSVETKVSLKEDC